MASDLSVSNLDFGVVIALVAPGFVTFQAVSYHMPTARAWMDAATNREQSVGVFLFVLLASLAIGVVVSGVRALVIDRFLTAPFQGRLRSGRCPSQMRKECPVTKTRIQRKLMLSKETLRSLSERGLQQAIGGAVSFISYCPCESEGCGPSNNCSRFHTLCDC